MINNKQKVEYNTMRNQPTEFKYNELNLFLINKSRSLLYYYYHTAVDLCKMSCCADIVEISQPRNNQRRWFEN